MTTVYETRTGRALEVAEQDLVRRPDGSLAVWTSRIQSSQPATPGDGSPGLSSRLDERLAGLERHLQAVERSATAPRRKIVERDQSGRPVSVFEVQVDMWAAFLTPEGARSMAALLADDRAKITADLAALEPAVEELLQAVRARRARNQGRRAR
jgi:hypothetical protein